ncbi:MAG: AsmA family protein [Candidatus Omnitrophota bacterium]|jgi:hypothetical protein
MKKVFLIIAIVLALLVAALALFIVTFDANRYKGILITRLEESTGKDIAIDDISLGFSAGLGIEVRGISMKDRDSSWDDPLLKAKSLDAKLELFPLLKKDIQVRRLSVEGMTINPGRKPSFKCALDLRMRILAGNAEGNIKLRGASLEDMNILKTALDKLNMLPGLVEKLRYSLPENYGVVLSRNNTVFKPMDLDFRVKEGRIFFDDFLIESDGFYLSGKGSVGMEQDMDIDADLSIQEDLSGVIAGIVPELSYLADEKGVIVIPLEISGKAPAISVIPDLKYVMERLFTSKGQELLERLLRGN